jgi:hypothetical protein
MPPVCGSIGETGGLPVVILTYCMSLVSGNKTIIFQDRVQGKIQDLQRSLENQLSSVFENNSDEQYREIIGTILKVKSWTTQAHQQIVWLKRMVVFLAVLGIINTAVALLF